MTPGEAGIASSATTDGGAGEGGAAIPLDTEFLFHAANRALKAHQWALGARLLEQYTRRVPEDGKAWYVLGKCRGVLGDYAGSAAAYERSAALRPGHLRTNALLGSMLFANGRWDEGRKAYARAMANEVRSERDQVVRGLLRLLHGDYERGWVDHEARWSMAKQIWAHPFEPSDSAPLWDGSAMPDRALCVHHEGGFGDAIMYCRFLPQIASRVGRLLLAVPPAVERLVAQQAPRAHFVREADEIPAGTPRTSWFGLPLHTGLMPDSIPGAGGYLRPPESGPSLGVKNRFRVGVVWAGNPKMAEDQDRSIPSVNLLQPLLGVDDVEWTSLQFGPRAEEAASLGLARMPAVGDFADTAHVLAQHDLVITVDTSVGHLAGALGVPVWIMLPSIPEYRWLLDRDDSPWYHSVRLFRRRHTSDWPETILRVREALLRHLGA